MADENDFRPGDNDNNLLRKILNRLGGTTSSGGSSSGALLVQGVPSFKVASAEFIRPADTNAYASNDVVNDNTSAGSAKVLTFADAVSLAGQSGVVVKAKLFTDSTVTTNALFRLHLYKVAPAPLGDNAPFTHLYADRVNYVGYIDFALEIEGTGSTTTYAVVNDANLSFVSGATANLFGVLEAKAAYVPASAENFRVELMVE